MQQTRPFQDIRWRGLDAAFDADLTPSVTAALPPAAAGLCFAAGWHVWCLAWLLTMVACIAMRGRIAQAYAARPASDAVAPWEARYRAGFTIDAAVLGFGLGLGLVLGEAAMLPAAVAACGLRLGLWLACPPCADAGRPAMVALLAPVLAGLLASPNPAGLALAGFCALAGAAFFTDKPPSPIAAAADAVAPELAPPVPQAVQDFQRLLGRDQVTGLPNKPGFLRILAEESQRAVRAQAPLGLLILTVDDLQGVIAANRPVPEPQLLAELGDTIRNCLRRQSDQLACLAPGRFAVLLPFTDALGATAAARNIANALAPLEEAEDGMMRRGPTATLSIGLAAYPGRGLLPETQLLQNAEEAEAAARRTGGNKISRYDPMAVTLRPLTFTERQAPIRKPMAPSAEMPAPVHSSVAPE